MRLLNRAPGEIERKNGRQCLNGPKHESGPVDPTHRAAAAVSPCRMRRTPPAVETEQFLGPKSAADGDDRHYAMPVELGADLLDLLPCLEREHGSPVVPLALWVADACAGVTIAQPTSNSPGERLAERPKHAVA
jgi:hypothetical protein